MLDVDQTYFGCGNKVSAKKLRVLRREDSFGFLADDNGQYIADNLQICSTIDTVFPFVSDFSVYARSAFEHCANDLYCSSVVPKFGTVSIGFSSYLKDHEISALTEQVVENFRANSVKCLNMHSFNADQTSITISLTGFKYFSERNKKKVPRTGKIYLTGELGNSVFVNLLGTGEVDEDAVHSKLISTNRNFVGKLDSINDIICTDVSGFGLYGHLLSVAEQEHFEISIWLNRIPFDNCFKQLFNKTYLSCSTRSNLDSFASSCDEICSLGDWQKELLFAGEINGPLLIFLGSDLDAAAIVEDGSSLYCIGEFKTPEEPSSRIKLEESL